MGQADIYPFVLPVPVIEKLDFINRLIAKSRCNDAGRVLSPPL
jgi:hypothetical protein